MWTELKIRGAIIANRFVHTAVGEGFAKTDGSASSRLRDRYALLGYRGAIGLIITGHVFVAPEAKLRDGQSGLWKDTQIAGFAKVSAAAKRDGSRIFMQLTHGGIMTSKARTGVIPKGPSALNIQGIEVGNAAMTLEEIAAWPELFANAARRAREAGFDGIQLHMGHGYGLCQWISPFYNKREDEYGGSIEKRARLPLEVIAAVRKAVGEDFPIIAKINGIEEGLEGGLTTEDAVQTAKLLEAGGLDGVEITGGSCILSDPKTSPMRPVKAGSDDSLYFRKEVKEFRKALNIPITLIGGVRSFKQAQMLRNNNEADLIGICRPLICEPDLVHRWHEGKLDKPLCISCGRCIPVCRTTIGVHCAVF